MSAYVHIHENKLIGNSVQKRFAVFPLRVKAEEVQSIDKIKERVLPRHFTSTVITCESASGLKDNLQYTNATNTISKVLPGMLIEISNTNVDISGEE